MALDTASPRPRFKLLAPDLNEGDNVRLAMFIRVAGSSLRGEWSIVSEGSGHVLLLDREYTQTVPGLVDEPISTLRLANGATPDMTAEGVLFRPLQYDALIEALVAVERHVLGSPAADKPSAAAQTNPAPAMTEPAAATEPAKAPSKATDKTTDRATDKAQVKAPSDFVQHAMAIVTKQAPQPFVPAAGETFRLQRWPSSALLRQHRYNSRLASFLSVRHVELDDLMRLSNVEELHCVHFLQALHAAGMLDIKRDELPREVQPKPPRQPAPRSQLTPPQPQPVRQPESPKPAAASVQSGFFAKMRRHFGIA